MPIIKVNYKWAGWASKFNELPLPEFIAALYARAGYTKPSSAEFTVKIEGQTLIITMTETLLDEIEHIVKKTDNINEITITES